jgi:hypothetical protein
MMGWLIAVPAILTYLTGTVALARWRFRQTRPFTEPLACEWSHHRKPEDHISLCYHRNSRTLIDSNGEAATFAVLVGLAWPLAWLPLAIMRLIMSGAPPTPEEVTAKIRRQEREAGIR